MAYTTNDAINTLNNYLGISEDEKQIIDETKNRGYILITESGEPVVIFTYPLVHKQDGSKNYFDSRDSGAKERQNAWKYALNHGMKYFCFGVNSEVDKYVDYVFSLECDERAVEILSGTKDGERNGPGNQIIIPNDFVPSAEFERIQNKLGISISAVHKNALKTYINLFDNRPYLDKYNNDVLTAAAKQNLPITDFFAVDAEEQKRRFRIWLENQVKPEGDSEAGQPYSKNTIDQYVSNVDNTFISDGKSLFSTSDIKAANKCALNLDRAEKKNNTQRSAVKKYIDFLQQEYSTLVYHTGYLAPSGFSNNRILFGAPGTGKSFTINKERRELLGDDNEIDYERVTFHPDYSYANFVGTYKPVPCKDSEGKDAITYKYVPGPFMRVYVKALKNARTNTPKPFLLIIEEINRADVAAVFGDVFQLLDRDDNNISEYPIQASEDIKKYLADELGGNPDNYSTIRIPDNMFIWATMNSADQGVFPMDTAFKRRWDFDYLGIDENDLDLHGKYVVVGSIAQQRIEWNSLRKAINDFLADSKINEDKQLGPYFISRNIVVPDDGGENINSDIFCKVFKSKVLMYLFDDAAKQKRPKMFEGSARGQNRYSQICEAFDEQGIGIFCNDIQSRVIKKDLRINGRDVDENGLIKTE
ncbi:MAG: AAA family ATPase [Lachnospiraceae bacterium]|nr:AAA family ATPase [Lachnospiraceae bacterium]